MPTLPINSKHESGRPQVALVAGSFSAPGAPGAPDPPRSATSARIGKGQALHAVSRAPHSASCAATRVPASATKRSRRSDPNAAAADGRVRPDQGIETGLPSPRPPGGLIAAVEDVGDVVDAFGTRRGISRGGAQVDVTEASRDLVDRDARLETVGGPVGPERVGMSEAVWHAGGQAFAVHEAVDGLTRECDRVLMDVTADPHEQRTQQGGPRAPGARPDSAPRYSTTELRRPRKSLQLGGCCDHRADPNFPDETDSAVGSPGVSGRLVSGRRSRANPPCRA